jgi:hypothetical protein
MHFIIGLAVLIAIAVWLWGEETVKTAIKWGLALLIVLVVYLIVK